MTMTKEILIQIIRDSLVNGNQKEAHDAIDDYVYEKQAELRSAIIELQEEALNKTRGISLVQLNKK